MGDKQTESDNTKDARQQPRRGFSSLFSGKDLIPYRRAGRIAVLYLCFSIIWISLSDLLMYFLIDDPDLYVIITMIKGWGFVIVSSLVIFAYLYYALKEIEEKNLTISEKSHSIENSNTLLMAVLDSSPDINVFSIDRYYRYSSFNTQHAKTIQLAWGRRPERGMSMITMITSFGSRQHIKGLLDRALGGACFSIVEEERDLDGKMNYFQSFYSPVRDKENTIVGVTCFSLNITALRVAEQRTEYLIYHDVLTGLYNRRYYEQALEELSDKKQLPLSIILGDINGLKLVNDAFGHKCGDQLLIEAANAFTEACRDDDIVTRWGGDEFIVLMPKTTYEEAEKIAESIKKIGRDKTVQSVHVDISLGIATRESVDKPIEKVSRLAEDRMYKNKVLESKSMRSMTITGIMNTLHEKNPREERHSKRVGELCVKIGHALKLTDVELSLLSMAAFLHDIGKIAIDETILNKRVKLDETEIDMLKKHPEIGCRIIRSSYEVTEIADAVLAHHERWDGAGYPKGLKGEAIPLLARIITLADAYDSMTSSSPYHEPFSHDEAAVEIMVHAGTQFDPKLARVFVEKVLEIPWKTVKTSLREAPEHPLASSKT